MMLSTFQELFHVTVLYLLLSSHLTSNYLSSSATFINF